MATKRIGSVILTSAVAAVTATTVALATFFGLNALKNRFLPNFGNPKIEVDVVTPIQEKLEQFFSSPESMQVAKEITQGFAKGRAEAQLAAQLAAQSTAQSNDDLASSSQPNDDPASSSLN